MFAPDIQILIPCHSLEDFPTDQTDEPAASLLNAFAVAFHPALLAWSGEIPRWRRADDPPLPRRGQLVIIPMVCDGWLPHGWADDARKAGSIVVSGLFERQKMIDAALAALIPEPAESDVAPVDSEGAFVDTEVPADGEAYSDLDPDLTADFLALGTCWLLVELLTRKMRQFGNIDETRFFQRAQAAAKAACANDREAAETHLRACFEILLEARERFYPVECYLLDLCLAVPDVNHDKLLPDSRQDVPWSLLVSSADLRSMCNALPDLKPALSEAWNAGRISLVGGEDREAPLPLLPLESVLYHFARGRGDWEELLGRSPIVWGRRKFGLTALLPQILTKFGFQAAMHVVLDDGIYPDAEYTKLRWRGVDGTLIDALSRIPLPAEGAASYLRFPVRMAESMDHDQVAGLILARWPEVEAPWFNDLRRSQKYAPCLGRFVTLDRFFEHTELPGQLSVHKSNEYFSPFLIQHVARRENRPISRYVEHAELRRRLDAAAWQHAVARSLMSRPIDRELFRSLEEQLESGPGEAELSLAEELLPLEQQVAAELVRIFSSQPGRGFLVFNSLSFTRRVVVPLPGLAVPPEVSGFVKAVDFDPDNLQATACVIDVPGNGFAWIPGEPQSVGADARRSREPARMVASPKLPLAENWLLRNDHFEVAINERTGGIAHIRFHDQRSKRLSQQLSFRFPRQRTIPANEESSQPTKTQYAEMKCLGSAVVRNGTACGEVATHGEIIDQLNGERLATYRQTVRVWRACPTVEIEIELADVKLPDSDPWNHYFTSRFAWNDGTAAVTRSIYHAAQSFGGERFETSDYIETASEQERLTIIPHGLPFHRQTGDRMLDSLLIVAGETKRSFRFTIAVDSPYPLEAAWNAVVPVSVTPVSSGPPRAGATGWFFHVDARNVQITRVLHPIDAMQVASPLDPAPRSEGPGLALRLVETEGRDKPVRLRCFRQPVSARKRDFRGETISELNLDGDAVVIQMSAFEVADVELRFSDH